MKSVFFVFLFGIFMFSSFSFGQILPGDTTQLIVVLTSDWDDSQGQLYCLEKKETSWIRRFEWPVTVGKKGMGWGKGLPFSPLEEPGKIQGPVKVEGDKKSPAGLFSIGMRLYGYDATPPRGVSLPYTQLTPDWLGIDDANSRYYNQIIKKQDVENPDWQSYEFMKREDSLYQWVILIEHNTSPAIPGAGSCIFFHLWDAPGSPTAGCTAMSEENLLQLARWLSSSQNPLLLQLPLPIFQRIRKKYGISETVCHKP